MNSAISGPADSSTKPRLLISKTSRNIPYSVPLLNQWQYGERTIHRLIAAWGRQMVEWEGKAALHRHIWDQAEIIRRIRERVSQFPGGKPEAGVSMAFYRLADAALHAPSFEDALDGIYKLLLPALTRAYVDYTQNAHPVHDAPTLAMFHEINTLKGQHYSWYRAYRRRYPHVTNVAYETAIEGVLNDAGNFSSVLLVNEDRAPLPCAADPGFFLPLVSFREKGWAPKFDIYPYFSADFADNIEARRLFWGAAYTQEMNLPDDQLAWLYYGDYMPWAWHYDISRHLWDESRHGCSGRSRLQDWGIAIQDVGFTPSSNAGLFLRHPDGTPFEQAIINPWIDEDQMDFSVRNRPMTSADLYDSVFHVGMVAETGHFSVKSEGYNDFRDAEDLDSAEMMLFDIIDETAHVQYAHRWLPLLAEHAGVDNKGYRERAVADRQQRQTAQLAFVEGAKALPRDLSYGPYAHYQSLLEKVRKACPIDNPENYANRSYRPM